MVSSTRILDVKALAKANFPASRQELVKGNRFLDRAQCILDTGIGLAVPATTVWGMPLPNGKDWKKGVERGELNNTDHEFALTMGKLLPYGPFVVGYGDPDSCYGAGPTRDPRRATYAARLLVRFEDVPLMSDGLLRKRESAPVEALNEWVAENADATKLYPASFSGWERDSLSFSFYVGRVWFGGRAVNLTRSKTGAAASIVRGDLVLVLNDGYFSGQAFIPDAAVRHYSPLYGKLETIYSQGSEVYRGIFTELKKRFEGMQKLASGLAKKLGVRGKPDSMGAIPIGVADFAAIITIDNT